VSVIHLKRTELFTSVIPSKLFECMGMGLPVLHGVEGESADIVCKEGVGLVFEPENAQVLATHLLALAADPDALSGFKARGLDAAQRYDRTALALRMLERLRATAASARAPM
jgi:hypothetical protein